MTYLKELFGQVVSSLLRNKLRSFLTMAGIAWGVASMVLIVAMGDGFKVGQRDRLKQLGENIVIRRFVRWQLGEEIPGSTPVA